MIRKVILSRKGFDSAIGGMPSPILPDGTLLSFPIPNKNEKYSYDDLFYKGQTYTELIHQLKPGFTYASCHLDPDLYPNIIKTRDPHWQACFGQSHAAQTHLEGNHIGKGDIFLFFGWFRQTELVNGVLRFEKDAPDLHIIYGYLEVDRKCTIEEELDEFKWHPHSSGPARNEKPNAIYVSSKSFLDTNMPGYGTFKYSRELVLTKSGMSRSKWDLPTNLKNKPMTYHSHKSDKGSYFQSAMIGQEFIMISDQNLLEWIKNIVSDNRIK